MSPGRPDEPVEGLIEGILQRDEETATPPGVASELLTFLVADIRGYTRFTQQRGDEAAVKLTSKFALIVRDLVDQFDGTVFELRGDEVLCVFSSPRQSLRLAIALQQRFVEETVADPSLPMTVGIGIDAGEAVRGPDGFRGGALNLAARLCARAKAGEVLASAEITHLARTIDGLRYVVLDRVEIKGLSDPVQPVRVLPEGEDPAKQIAALLTSATPSGTARRPVRWLPAPLAARPRLTLAGAVVVAAVVAGALVVAAEHGSGGGAVSALGENSVGVLDPQSGHLDSQLTVDARPVAAVAGFHSVWTANADANTVSRVDSSSRQIHPIDVGTAPSAIAVGFNSVWVANGGSGTVSRIDPATNEAETIEVGAAPAGITVGGNAVWVTNAGDGTVSRIDPLQNKAVESVAVGESPTGISAGRDVWVVNSADNTVSKINGSGPTHAEVQVFHVGNNPKGVAVIGGYVWITNNLDGSVSRISTTGASGPETAPVAPQPTQIVAVDGHIWTASQGPPAITEIDPESLNVIRRVPIAAIPGGMTATGGKLWVTTTINPTLHRGGTIHIRGDDIGSIDPTYIENVSAESLLNGSYDGLVGFRHGNGADGIAIVPDLAVAIPSPTNGGRTYAFQLRKGIRWSTGQPLTVFDVRRGLERAIASGFLKEIVGASRCGTKDCDASGIAVDATAGSLTITLVRPDGNFLDTIANGIVAVPDRTPLAEQKTFAIPATGPYQVARYDPGKLVVLTRNRFFHEWSAAAQPAGYPDRIEWRIDTSSDVRTHAVDDVAAGRTDWADARGAAPLGKLEARFGARVRVTPTETMHGLYLNTRIAPFNDKNVRRALAYAIDRKAVADKWGTSSAVVTCQILPPNYPGYRPYCPYTVRHDATETWKSQDVLKAESLARGSPALGTAVTVYADEDSAPSLHQVVSVLRTLGFHARLSVLPEGGYFDYVLNWRNKVQAAFMGWVPADASAENLLHQWSCDAFTPAQAFNNNPSGFCDPSIDRLMSQAARVQVSSLAAANRLWAEVDRRIVDAAPWIPLVTPRWVDVISKRVHNYARSPVIGMLFDQMWVR